MIYVDSGQPGGSIKSYGAGNSTGGVQYTAADLPVNFDLHDSSHFTGMVNNHGATDGVASLDVQYSSDDGASWNPVPVQSGSASVNSDGTAGFNWCATAKVGSNGIGDGSYLLRGLVTNVAGSTAATAPSQVVVDTAVPSTTLSADTTANSNGWRDRETTLTFNVKDDDPKNILETDYAVVPLGSPAPAGGWKIYSPSSRPILTKGQWTVWFRSKTKALREESPQSQTFKINTVGPDPVDPDYKPSMLDYYLAEGNTYPWNDEYITVYNPSDSATAKVRFEYMYTDGTVTDQSVSVSPLVRTTITVKSVPNIRLDCDVAAHVQSDNPIVVERPCYFNCNGIDGGFDVVGIDTLYSEYYLAEGTTRAGFQTWLTLLNPGTSEASVTVNYILGNGQVIPKTVSVGAKTRKTIDVNNDVGANRDVSFHIISNQPIAVERPMYMNYMGITGGTVTAGSPLATRQWDFAEGNTHSWNTEYLCIENPGESDANVHFNFLLGTGQTILADATVSPHSRSTYDIRQWVPTGNDVSTQVTSNQVIVAERPMYFVYQNAWKGASNNMGITSLRTKSEYYLAEGYTGSGFAEWITVGNPSDESREVNTVYSSNGGRVGGGKFRIGPHQRLTINMNKECPNHEVSVDISSAGKIIVERPMYFSYSSGQNHNLQGGSIASGYPNWSQ